MVRIIVIALDKNVTSPKLDSVVGEMGAVVLVNKFNTQAA
jgi:hypothetical protein